jgi:hypothetical protein
MGICCGGGFIVTTAVPQPQGNALLLAGCGVVGLLAQRRRRQATRSA